MPTINWIGSPNFWPGRAGQKIMGICYHIEDGTEAGTESTFQHADPVNGVSAHYSVARDGTIHQYVREGDSAWANGPLNQPDLTNPVVAYCVQNGINPNRVTVSIETEAFRGQPLTEPQYQSILWLTRQILARYPWLKPSREDLLGHYQFDRVNRPFCPGPLFPWARLLADLNGGIVPADYPHWVVGNLEVNNEYGFLSFHQGNGGVAIFGLPISGAFFDPVGQRVVQWFERARFERHEEATDPLYKVQLGLLGVELRAKN